MSSNPRPDLPARTRWRPPPWRAWPLRSRLLVWQLVLLAVVCLAVGGITELALHQFLVGQLDHQLTAASGRSVGAFGSPRGGPPPSTGEPRILRTPGQSAGTLGAHITGGHIDQAAVLRRDGTIQPIPPHDYPMLMRLPVDGRPHTVALGHLGAYRAAAAPAPDGDVIITGLPLAGVDDTLTRLAVILAAVAAAGLVAAGVAATITIRRTLRPLRRVAATATEVTELPLDRGEVALSVRVPDIDTDPRTEVGQVGAALNRMLGHVATALTARQASETRVRQFVADASHELRTPLATIRGYTELTRRVRHTLPADVAHALDRVDAESTRMTALVEDLLLLARLDAGRPLRAEPVDLSRMAADTVSDARIAGPGHHWRLVLPDEPVTVPGDETRLHQVLANLLANARTHTPAGTTVTTAVSTPDAESAVVTVADTGPGISPELRRVVFERFARGEHSRSRATGSTGLGLAIVDAIVAAHHGTVEIASSPGDTTFTVRLPRDHQVSIS